jgi:hypothetical protein
MYFVDIDSLTAFIFLMIVHVEKNPNIELDLQDHTSIDLNTFNTILDTANTYAELNHSWVAIERDISAQE